MTLGRFLSSLGALFLAGSGCLAPVDAPAGAAPNIEPPVDTPSVVQPTGALVHAKQVVVTPLHGCAVLEDDTVACWGKNKWGELGGATNATESKGAVVVPGLRGVAHLAAGFGMECPEGFGECESGGSTCALLKDGTVRCWGLGNRGQLGNGRQGEGYFEATPVDVGQSGVVDLQIEGDSACAVTGDGKVACWGSNAYEIGFRSSPCGPFHWPGTETGNRSGTEPCETAPRIVSAIVEATSVAVGQMHRCVLHRNGEVSCWGVGNQGQLGRALPSDDWTAVEPSGPIAGLSATQVSTGQHHGCAVLADETVQCWGSNGSGALGTDTMERSRAVPGALPGVANVKVLRLAHLTGTALLADGSAVAWGNLSGILADGTPSDLHAPTKIPWVVDGIDIATSGSDSCVIHADRTVTCWQSQWQTDLRFQR